jgi:hypothetical protein
LALAKINVERYTKFMPSTNEVQRQIALGLVEINLVELRFLVLKRDAPRTSDTSVATILGLDLAHVRRLAANLRSKLLPEPNQTMVARAVELGVVTARQTKR